MKKDKTHIVVPGLSLTSKDIMNRIKNRSIDLTQAGQYIDDRTLADNARMSRLDAAIAALKNSKHISNLKQKLNHGS